MENTPSTQSNSSSRSRLLEAARELFYDQGYVATTLAQISEKSGVNNGLITYYFKSKRNMAGEIYNMCLMELRNAIAQYLFLHTKEYSMALDVALETRILLEQKFKNPNFLRFCIEYQRERDHFDELNLRRERYYSLQKELINPEISDLDLKLYSVCGIAVTERISEAFAKKYIDCDYEYLKDYVTRTLFTMLQLSEEDIEKLIESSRIWEVKLRFKIGPAFQITRE